MSQTKEDKHQYFTVGLLKESFALEALCKDALKHHMTEHLGQLIALRLTEYYQMMTEGVVQPVVRIPALVKPLEPISSEDWGSRERLSSSTMQAPSMGVPSHLPSPAAAQTPNHHVLLNEMTGNTRAIPGDGEDIIFTSPAADQNADEAADYWSPL